MQKKCFIFDIGNVLVDFDFQVLLQQIAADSRALHDSNAATHPGLWPPLQRRGAFKIPSAGGVPGRRGGFPDSGTPLEKPTERDLEMHHAVEEGVISDQAFVDYLNEAKGLSWTVDDLIGVWQKMFTVNQTGYGLFREAIARGLPVYTLSNIAEHHIEAIERNWPGFFDGATGLFLSYQVGARKPNAGIYRHLLDDLGVKGEQCLFLDDRADNVEAARTAGIQTHQFIPGNYVAIREAVDDFFS